ncbi:hypothetical protein EDM56_08620 [Brevibacillus fluminis]|uniref:Type II secretion system protein n=2 Tax=Brevibacillus fluminis TaxID=511487 RepID=A0A3M8DR06_9BACL|nr:hypothetical protein EDM56_08620 [Brevibacillus fluminis]
MSYIYQFRSERGSSLIEVIAAIMIISIISLTFIKYFYQAQSTAQVSDRKLITSTLARQEALRWKDASFQKVRLKLIGVTADQVTEDLEHLLNTDPSKLTDSATATIPDLPAKLEDLHQATPAQLLPPLVDVSPVTLAPKTEADLDHINGTTYHTKVVLTNVNSLSKSESFEDLLVKATVTVYWGDAPDAASNPRTSTTVECFITKEDLRR